MTHGSNQKKRSLIFLVHQVRGLLDVHLGPPNMLTVTNLPSCLLQDSSMHAFAASVMPIDGSEYLACYFLRSKYIYPIFV